MEIVLSKDRLHTLMVEAINKGITSIEEIMGASVKMKNDHTEGKLTGNIEYPACPVAEARRFCKIEIETDTGIRMESISNIRIINAPCPAPSEELTADIYEEPQPGAPALAAVS